LAHTVGGAIAGFPLLGSNPEAAAKIMETVQSKARQPQTPVGAHLAGTLGRFGEKLDTGITDLFGNVPGGPIPQTIARTAVQAPIEVLGLKGAGKVGSGVAKGLPTPPPPPPGSFVPSVSDLFRAGTTAFTQARRHGGLVGESAASRLSDSISNLKNSQGLNLVFDKDLHGPASIVRNRIINDLDAGGVDFDNLLTLRQLAGEVAGNAEKSIAKRGMAMKNAIDDFVDNMTVDDLVGAGDPEAAAAALKTARSLWRDASKAETLEKLVEIADIDSEFAGVGSAAWASKLRNQLKQLDRRITQGKEKGWKADEIEAIRQVIKGDGLEKFYRLFERLAPVTQQGKFSLFNILVGGTPGAFLGTGAATALGLPGPLGMAVGGTMIPTLGLLARGGAARGTTRGLDALNRTVRTQSLINP
jgi:hypothetical protein